MKTKFKLKKILLAIGFGLGLSGIYTTSVFAIPECNNGCYDLKESCENGDQMACSQWSQFCKGCF